MRLLRRLIGGDDESMHGCPRLLNKASDFKYLCGLKLAEQHQDDQHDQNHPAKPHPGMAQAVAIAAEPAREAAQQEYDQDDDEYRSKRHGGLPERPRAAWRNAPRPGSKHNPGRESLVDPPNWGGLSTVIASEAKQSMPRRSKYGLLRR